MDGERIRISVLEGEFADLEGGVDQAVAETREGVVTLALPEPRLGLPALPQEGTVAVYLQILREIAQPCPSLPPPLLAQRAPLGQQVPELTLELLLLLLLEKLRKTDLLALALQPLDDDVREPVESPLLLHRDVLHGRAGPLRGVEGDALVEPHPAHVLHLAQVDGVLEREGRRLLLLSPLLAPLEVVHRQQLLSIGGLLTLWLDNLLLVVLPHKEEALVDDPLALVLLAPGQAPVVAGVGDAALAGEGSAGLEGLVEGLGFVIEEGLAFLH